MPRIDMSDYTPAAKRYWWTVTIAGWALLAYAFWHSVRLDLALFSQILLGAAIAALVGLFPVRIPGTKVSIAGGDIFIFLVLLQYGAEAAALAAALEGLVASWRTSKRWTSRLGTPAMAAVAMFACGSLFDAARGQLPANGAASAVLPSFLLVFAALYFVANTILTSTLFALKTNALIRPFRWLRSFGWVGLAYVVSGAVAGVLFMGYERFGLPVLLVAVPVIALFLSTLHAYFERQESEERHVAELKESESRFHSAFMHAAIGMALVGTDGTFKQANRAFSQMVGRSEPELLETTLAGVVNRDDLPALQTLLGKLVRGQIPSVRAEVRGVHRTGAEVWMDLQISLARDWQFRSHNLIVQAQDISARRHAEAELYHNAYHDDLTQLSNRAHFSEHLRRAMVRVTRHPDKPFAVMYLDLDRFKLVNDSLGHRAGDELLVELARRLKESLRPYDVIARLGGDEFAILLEELARERDAVDLAERVQGELHKPIALGPMEVTISASIGITFSTIGYDNADQIIRDADIAMYKAKSKGKGHYAIFDASLHEHVAAQLRLENELHRALGQGQLYLDYQPIYSLRDHVLIGFEALCRWKHPQRGLLEPSLFIPTAEESGLIVPLGDWVLEEACRQMRAWRETHGASELGMSVNVSCVQLRQGGFVEHVRKVLHASGMKPAQLTLEVTESVLMDGTENAIGTLKALRDLGVLLSIDDFGTGYSSLNYLAMMPIDALKVDRSFIDRMCRDGEGNEIVRAIFKLGHALSKRVFAEGIETGAQLTLLKELGCEFGQGYLLSRPVDAERASHFIADGIVAA